jgi:hypothetical protein
MTPENNDPDMDDDNFGYDDLDDVDVPMLDEEEALEEAGDWDDEAPVEGTKPKRSSGGLSFNTMVIIGAVVLGAGVLIFNVMSQSKNQEQKAGQTFQSTMSVSGVLDGDLAKMPDAAGSPQEQTQEGGALEPIQSPVPDDQNSDGFFGEDTSGLDAQGQNNSNTPPQPAAISPADKEGVITPMPQDGAPELPKENSAQELLKQAMAKRDAQDQKEQTSVEEESYPAPSTPDQIQPAIAAPIVPPQSVAVDPKLVEKMDQILSRMDKLEGDIDALKQEKSPDIGELEQNISLLKEELSSIRSVAKDDPSEPKRIVTPKKASAASSQKITKPAKAASPKKTASLVQWELRAAQPGRAWVSKSGERDMQSVEVGQSLAGIGTISAISYQNGRWLVQGSMGQIRQ